jgi:hypothetical protein
MVKQTKVVPVTYSEKSAMAFQVLSALKGVINGEKIPCKEEEPELWFACFLLGAEFIWGHWHSILWTSNSEQHWSFKSGILTQA